jgi:hypothetical protein
MEPRRLRWRFYLQSMYSNIWWSQPGNWGIIRGNHQQLYYVVGFMFQWPTMKCMCAGMFSYTIWEWGSTSWGSGHLVLNSFILELELTLDRKWPVLKLDITSVIDSMSRLCIIFWDFINRTCTMLWGSSVWRPGQQSCSQVWELL